MSGVQFFHYLGILEDLFWQILLHCRAVLFHNVSYPFVPGNSKKRPHSRSNNVVWFSSSGFEHVYKIPILLWGKHLLFPQPHLSCMN